MDNETLLIQHWLDQHCIGYQMTDGVITHSVTQGRVRLTSGREMDAWIIAPLASLVPHTGEDGLVRYYHAPSRWGITTFIEPRIDRQVKELADER